MPIANSIGLHYSRSGSQTRSILLINNGNLSTRGT